jgi:hypothetical protein
MLVVQTLALAAAQTMDILAALMLKLLLGA